MRTSGARFNKGGFALIDLGKAVSVEREQPLARHVRAGARAPSAENDVEGVDLPGGDAHIEGLDHAIGEPGDARGMRRHRALPAGDNSLLRDRRASTRSNQEQLAFSQIAMNGSENPLAERPGETLLGAEDHQRGSDRSGEPAGGRLGAGTPASVRSRARSSWRSCRRRPIGCAPAARVRRRCRASRSLPRRAGGCRRFAR